MDLRMNHCDWNCQVFQSQWSVADSVLKLPSAKSSTRIMKIQKELRKFCPKCKTHTSQVIAIYKKGKDRRTAEGARRHEEDKRGYGGQKFPELKRTAKTSKKITLRYTCKNCQRKSMREGMRIRKLEILSWAKLMDMRRDNIMVPKPRSKFISIQCPNCSEKRVIFTYTTTDVYCKSCAELVAKKTGAKADILGKVVSVLD